MSFDSLNKACLEKEFGPILTSSAIPSVKGPAIEYLLGLTGTEEGKLFIGSSEKFLKSILELTDDREDSIVKLAYETLINLTTLNTNCEKILALDGCKTLILDRLEKITKSESLHADLICKFLSNLTRPEQCSIKVAEIIKDNKDKVTIVKLVTILCTKNFNAKADLNYLALIMANLTQVRHIREDILRRDQWVIQRLLSLIDYKESDICRLGVVSCVKNCCFDDEHHEWLLSDKVDILPRLLLPLAGPEEFDDDDMEKLPDDLQYLPPDKTREPNSEIRRILVQSVFKLCATKKGRLYVKDKNTYVIMREYHRWESERSNVPAIMNLIDVLIQDEPEPGMENLHDVQIPEDLRQKFKKEDEEEEKEYMGKE